MLLSVALPADDELENALENAILSVRKKDPDLLRLRIMQRNGEKRGIFMYLQQVPVL